MSSWASKAEGGCLWMALGLLGVGAERRKVHVCVFTLQLRSPTAMELHARSRATARMPALSTWKWPDLPNSSTVQWVRVALSGLEKEILGDQLSIIWLTESTGDGRQRRRVTHLLLHCFPYLYVAPNGWEWKRKRSRAEPICFSQVDAVLKKRAICLLATQRVSPTTSLFFFL